MALSGGFRDIRCYILGIAHASQSGILGPIDLIPEEFAPNFCTLTRPGYLTDIDMMPRVIDSCRLWPSRASNFY